MILHLNFSIYLVFYCSIVLGQNNNNRLEGSIIDEFGKSISSNTIRVSIVGDDNSKKNINSDGDFMLIIPENYVNGINLRVKDIANEYDTYEGFFEIANKPNRDNTKILVQGKIVLKKLKSHKLIAEINLSDCCDFLKYRVEINDNTTGIRMTDFTTVHIKNSIEIAMNMDNIQTPTKVKIKIIPTNNEFFNYFEKEIDLYTDIYAYNIENIDVSLKGNITFEKIKDFQSRIYKNLEQRKVGNTFDFKIEQYYYDYNYLIYNFYRRDDRNENGQKYLSIQQDFANKYEEAINIKIEEMENQELKMETERFKKLGIHRRLFCEASLKDPKIKVLCVKYNKYLEFFFKTVRCSIDSKQTDKFSERLKEHNRLNQLLNYDY